MPTKRPPKGPETQEQQNGSNPMPYDPQTPPPSKELGNPSQDLNQQRDPEPPMNMAADGPAGKFMDYPPTEAMGNDAGKPSKEKDPSTDPRQVFADPRDVEPSPDEDDSFGNSQGRPRAAKSTNPVSDFVDYYFGTAEQTWQESSYVPETMIKPYNPDDLVQKDQTYRIYDTMTKDDQVAVALQLKKDLVLAAGYEIHVQDSEPMSQMIKQDLEVALSEDSEIPIEEALENILTAYEFGFSLSEKVFKNRADGSLTLKFIKSRHPATWLIHTDPRGNISRFEQRTRAGSVDVPPESLIHYVNNGRFQNPYGRSDLRAAYAAYFIKQEIVKYYAIFMEKAASPVPVAKYEKNAPQKAVDDLYLAIKKFQTKTAMAVPKDVELDFLEAKNDGTVFEKAISIFNMFIGRALMIPDLLGFQGGETSGGSYSLGKDQIQILFKHVLKRRTYLEKIINQHIIKPLVIYNYGFLEKFPRFRLKPIQDEQLVELAKLWTQAAGKVFKPNPEEINYFRSLCQFPEGDVQEMQQPGQDPNNPIDPKTGMPMPMDHPNHPLNPANPHNNLDTNGQPMPAQKALPPGLNPGGNAQPGKPGAPGQDDPKATNGAAPTDPKAAQKPGQEPDANAKSQEGKPGGTNTEDGKGLSDPANPGKAGMPMAPGAKVPSGASTAPGAKPSQPMPIPGHQDPKGQAPSPKDDPKKAPVKFSLKNTPGPYARKVNFKMIETQLDSFETSLLNEVKPIVKKIIRDLVQQIRAKKIIERNAVDRIDTLKLKYLNQIQTAFRQNFVGAFQEAQKIAMNELEGDGISKKRFAQPALPNDEFMKVLEQELYQYIGDWEYKITQKARLEIIKAIKDGTPISEVAGILSQDGEEMSDVSMERYARTKFTEVMNRGRVSYFDSTGVVSAYQYSAILDDRTTDVCAGLDGCIFEAGDQPIPPLHFNCRSMVVPITKYEDYDVSKSANNGQNIDKFIAQNKGDGFAVQ